MMGAGDYVRALEPATNHERPRATLRERGQLKMLAPGEEVNYRLIEFHPSPNNLSAVSRRICRFDPSDSGRL
jgi:hypothetical protein